MFSGPELQALSVFVVDDNKFMRTVVKNLCRGLGLGDFWQAEDVDQGLKVMRDNEVDLVITDWHMEPTDGLEFVHFLRNDPASPNPYVPIIMLTGHGDRDRVCGPSTVDSNRNIFRQISSREIPTQGPLRNDTRCF